MSVAFRPDETIERIGVEIFSFDDEFAAWGDILHGIGQYVK